MWSNEEPGASVRRVSTGSVGWTDGAEQAQRSDSASWGIVYFSHPGPAAQAVATRSCSHGGRLLGLRRLHSKVVSAQMKAHMARSDAFKNESCSDMCYRALGYLTEHQPFLPAASGSATTDSRPSGPQPNQARA